MSITLHIHPDQFKVELGAAASDHPAYIVIGFDKTHDVVLFLDNPARCDALIAAATEAKRLLAGASAAADLDRAIAADVAGQTATRVPLDAVGDEPRPDMFVVVNVEPDGHRVTITDPGLKDQCERYMRENARYHAGTLEVAPARPEDLDDADGAS